MVSTLFSSLNTKFKEQENGVPVVNDENRPQPVLLVLQETIQIFKDIATLWIDDHDVNDVSI